MAPELFGLDSDNEDEDAPGTLPRKTKRSDLYALGMVSYEVLEYLTPPKQSHSKTELDIHRQDTVPLV